MFHIVDFSYLSTLRKTVKHFSVWNFEASWHIFSSIQVSGITGKFMSGSHEAYLYKFACKHFHVSIIQQENNIAYLNFHFWSLYKNSFLNSIKKQLDVSLNNKEVLMIQLCTLVNIDILCKIFNLYNKLLSPQTTSFPSEKHKQHRIKVKQNTIIWMFSLIKCKIFIISIRAALCLLYSCELS